MSEFLGERRDRVERLVEWTQRLVTGPLPSEEIKSSLPILEACSPEDVVDAVDKLVASGVELEALKGGVSRLLNLLHRSLAGKIFAPQDPLFRLLMAENQAALALLAGLRPALGHLLTGGAESWAGAVEELSLRCSQLGGLIIHYERKENVLFPYFEARYPRYRCLSLMWSIHDDVRQGLKDIESTLLKGSAEKDRINRLFGRLFFDINTLAFREDKLLFPVMAGLLSETEQRRLYFESRSLGSGLLEAPALAALDALARGEVEEASHAGSLPQVAPNALPPEGIHLNAGHLDRETLDAILTTLPFDMTFVDAEDRVRYFSNGPERIFPRSPAIIGREVRNCHPASSVDKVMAIIAAFKRGEREREAFWIQLRGRFIHIEYRAIRSRRGEYLGTLEISQDLTDLRSLEGEKRLASF